MNTEEHVPNDASLEQSVSINMQNQTDALIKHRDDRVSSQGVQGEGGDPAGSKVAPFPGYRDAAVVDAEEDGDSWSAHTYDSEEEAHNRTVFFSFLGLLLCCGLIIASIIIVYMASTQNMKATTVQDLNQMLITKKMLADNADGYDFSFSRNTLKYGVVMTLELNMDKVDQTGWSVEINDDRDKSKKDIVVTFTDKTKVTVTNSNSPKASKTAPFDLTNLEKGLNTISFEMSKNGYIVRVNDDLIIDDGAKDNTVLASYLGYNTVSQINVKGLAATVTTLTIDQSGLKVQ